MQVVYPKRFISRTINNFLNDSSQDDNIIPNFLFEERKKVFIRLPFCGKNEKLSKTFIAKLNKFFIHLSLLMMNSSVLILAVCRTPVTYELSKMTLLSMSSRSSVDRAPARCYAMSCGEFPKELGLPVIVVTICSTRGVKTSKQWPKFFKLQFIPILTIRNN